MIRFVKLAVKTVLWSGFSSHNASLLIVTRTRSDQNLFRGSDPHRVSHPLWNVCLPVSSRFLGLTNAWTGALMAYENIKNPAGARHDPSIMASCAQQ